MSLLKAACAVAFAALTIAACSGAQGDDCSKDSDCRSNLTCQPISGRSKLYCCPTPPESSDYANCHPDWAALAAQKNAQQSSPAPADAGGGG